MLYDSQYTKDQCTMRRPPDAKRQLKNATVVAVCRRLIQAATEKSISIKWVKVKGHSGDEGNDAADKRANWAQDGGTKREQEIDQMMMFLRSQGDSRT
jgi:ribonuclease HI